MLLCFDICSAEILRIIVEYLFLARVCVYWSHSDSMIAETIAEFEYYFLSFFFKFYQSPFLLRPEYCVSIPNGTLLLDKTIVSPLPLLPALTSFIVLFFKCHIHSRLFEGRLEKASAWDLGIIFSKLIYLLTS